ncbi:O-antigen ligase family protein [Natronosalvus vescus]|uniref:O-antigen ligase family protein n=1 Tax=Natronosalvus vescus TaxID=2953881 RepID=UPI002091D5C0|nr:O-antigen ligase family protein [Natronosalvus vescus]
MSYSKWKQSRIPQTAIFSAIAIIGIILIFLSQSRRVFIYLFICIFLILGTNFGQRTRLIELVMKGTVAVISLGLVGFLMYVSGILPPIFAERLDVFEGRGSLENRYVPILLAARYFSETMILGSGYNNFELHLNDLAVTAAEEHYAHKPHNMLIIPFVEGGIFAGFGILALVGIICWRSIISWRAGRFNNSEVEFVFVACTIAFFAAQMFGVLSILRVNWLIIFLGLVSLHIITDKTRMSELRNGRK